MLATIREKFSGTVKLIFQPAEEVLGGAKKIIAAGAMDNPKADSIVALHCSPEYYIGQVGIATGGIMASSDKFVVTMKGKGAHASTPFQGINPVLGVSMAITALQNIVGQEINTIEQAVVQTCTIEGGTAFNIIPEKASFSGTIRCLNSSVRDKIEESFKE